VTEKSLINESQKYKRCTFHHIAGKPQSDRIFGNLAYRVSWPT